MVVKKISLITENIHQTEQMLVSCDLLVEPRILHKGKQLIMNNTLACFCCSKSKI